MSTDTHEERLERRISDLYATDQQFADARPSDSIAHALESPELGLSQIVQTVLDGYAERPALGQPEKSRRGRRSANQAATWCISRSQISTRRARRFRRWQHRS